MADHTLGFIQNTDYRDEDWDSLEKSSALIELLENLTIPFSLFPRNGYRPVVNNRFFHVNVLREGPDVVIWIRPNKRWKFRLAAKLRYMLEGAAVQYQIGAVTYASEFHDCCLRIPRQVCFGDSVQLHV